MSFIKGASFGVQEAREAALSILRPDEALPDMNSEEFLRLRQIFECRACQSCRDSVTWAAFEKFLLQGSKCWDLKNIVLLIAPVEWPNPTPEEYKVHCYRLNTSKHWGVTTVSQEVLLQIERHNVQDAYLVVKSNRPIAHVDAVLNTLITTHIFSMVREPLRVERHTWYKGEAVKLTFRGRGRIEDRNGSIIQSLRPPKIPVRMQCRLTSKVKKAPDLPRIKAGASRLNSQRKPESGLRRRPQAKSVVVAPSCCPCSEPSPRTSQTFIIEKDSNLRVLPDSKSFVIVPSRCSSELSQRTSQNLTPLRWMPESKSSVLPSSSCCSELAPPTPRQSLKIIEIFEGAEIESSEEDVSPEPKPKRSLLQIEAPSPRHSLIFVDYSNIFGRPLGPRSLMQDPPVLPLSFSNAAFCFLEEKLRWPCASGAFLKLRRLVQQINARQRPRLEHLMGFFYLTEALNIKLFIRREVTTSCHGDRYLMDCYVFDDRKDYIGSIGLLATQLHAVARLYPKTRKNFRFVDDAFELTPIPGKVSKWLDVVSDTSWYKCLGELTLAKVRPPMAILELPEIGDEAGV